MTEWVLSVDPGLRACGLALWRGGELRAAALVPAAQSIDDGELDLLATRVARMGVAAARWARAQRDGDLLVVAELMRTYGGSAARGDANDLIALSLVTGMISGLMREPMRLVPPSEWKGTIPKRNGEGVNVVKERVVEALSATEKVRIELPSARLEHNLYDALGIGLWWLRKTGARR